MLTSQAHYPAEIEDNATKFGFKAANLLYLSKFLHNIQEELTEKTSVEIIIPKLIVIHYETIKNHLDTYAPEWRTLFSDFERTFSLQIDKTTLNEDTKEKLLLLNNCLRICFKNHVLTSPDLTEFISSFLPKQLFMIRSTGINEDKVDMANPGGNESVPSRGVDIEKTLGEVVAPYVGEKSISQRLKSGDESITQLPVMPVLIQVLVGEDKHHNNQVISGVAYTNNGSMRIQSSLGHGEYVVNSKGPTDNYYISKEGVTYKEIRPKPFRLAPKYNRDKKAIDLEWEVNSIQEEYTSSLPPEAINAIQLIANKIEALYGMRMDIEFIYEPQSNRLNIVQARPIPLGERKGQEPSALSPTYLSSPTQTQQTIEGLQVITPEVNSAAVVTDRSQVLICKTIEEALDRYIKHPDSKSIRAVIVENYAPDTSHEAGQFNLNAIPVMRVSDLTDVERLLEASTLLVIIDPQHSKIYSLDPSLCENESNPDLAEKVLYLNKILENGIFASSLSAHISSDEYHFNYDEDKSTQVLTPIENALDAFKSKSQKFGELVKSAQIGNTESLQLLLSLAYEVMNYSSGDNQDNEIIIESELRNSISTLGYPKIGEDNSQGKAALAQILKIISNLHRNGHLSNDIYRKIILTSSELAILLDNMQNSEFLSSDKETKNALYLTYFDVERKLEASILGFGAKGVLAQSAIKDLVNEKHKANIENLAHSEGISLEDLSDTQRSILYEVTKLHSSFAHSEINDNWKKFCIHVCTNSDAAGQLAEMVSHLVTLNIDQRWLNVFFDKKYIAASGNINETFISLKQDFLNLDVYSNKVRDRLLLEIENQIPLWADKTKFDSLYEPFIRNINQLNKILNRSNKSSSLQSLITINQVKRCIDIIDRTIKSLAYSRDYENNAEDNILRGQRYRKLLAEFFTTMYPWLLQAFPNRTRINAQFYLMFNKEILDTSQDASPIRGSTYFNASSLNISKNRDIFISCRTLEDWFTTVHHYFTASINEIENQHGLMMDRKAYPPLLEEFEVNLMKLKGKILSKQSTPVSNPEHIINPNYKHLIIYNLPLSVHNAVIAVFQENNVRSPEDANKFYVKFSCGSPFSEEFQRWQIIQNKMDFDLAIAGIKTLSAPYFKHDSYYRYSSSICVELLSDDIPMVLTVIEMAIAQTYFLFNRHTPEDEERFLKLEQLSEGALKRMSEQAFDLIFSGYFSTSYFLNQNTEARMNILHNIMSSRKFSSFGLEDLSDNDRKLSEIRNLLYKSTLYGRKNFIHQLYNNPQFDDKFCVELTGYNKIDFAMRYFPEPFVREVLSPLMTANNETKLLDEIKNFIGEMDISPANPTARVQLRRIPPLVRTSNMQASSTSSSQPSSSEPTSKPPTSPKR